MLKWLHILLIFAFGFIGAYLVRGCDEGINWRLPTRRENRTIEAIRRQLADLKVNLIKYRQTHGCYPTNDEGLTCLNDFAARFPIHMAGENAEAARRSFLDGMEWRFPGGTAGQIARFRELGRSVSNEEEFQLVFPSHGLHPESRQYEVSLAISGGDEIYFLGSGGVMSPWMVPFLYENRNGLDDLLFNFSPVERDPERRYSIEVDKGIYVYAVGGEMVAAEHDRYYDDEYRGAMARLVSGWALMGIAAFLVLLAIWRIVPFLLRAGTLVAALLVAFLMPQGFTGTTCYLPSPLFCRRPDGMVQAQRDLLERYRSAGVISDPAYRRAIDRLDLDKVLVPTTRSEGDR